MGRPGRGRPTLAGGAAVPRWGERVAAGQGLAGPAAAGHKAPKAGTQAAGLSGVRELLVAQVGHSQILTAFKGRVERGRKDRLDGSKACRGPCKAPRLGKAGSLDGSGLHWPRVSLCSLQVKPIQGCPRL